MLGFNDIIGHEEIIRHLKNAIQTEKVSHSYIFTGDPGSGKKLLAGTYAMTLQCEEGGTEPCGHCDSCKKAIGKNHPDIIMVTHEKPNVITIDEIREQIINDVDIKPYCSPYKIYIVANAELMNPQAQNALLKTIEEPPEYAVIMLLTSNIDAMLPTIRSRCVRLDLKVVDDGLVKKYLMEHLHIPDYQAEIDASYAHGSIGRAKQVATSQEFADMTQNALRILKNADGMEVYELTEAIKELSNDKQNISDYLDLFQFWFRDVLMFKATREVDNLVFKQEINYIREQASQRSYENLEKILDALEKTKVRLRGAGFGRITIEGVKSLRKPEPFTPIFDRIEAGTFMVAAAITNSKLTINGVNEQHLMPNIEKLKECGVHCIVEGNRMIVDGTGEKKPVDIKTMPYPGFPTDMQPQMMVLLSMTPGVSVITETVFENRFMHVSELGRMGANIKIDGKVAIVEGVSQLTGCNVKATDLRAGAAMILAGLVANGQTEIGEVYHIDRGYTNIEEKFIKLGANIERVTIQ